MIIIDVILEGFRRTELVLRTNVTKFEQEKSVLILLKKLKQGD